MCKKSKAEVDSESKQPVVEPPKNYKDNLYKCSECYESHYIKAGQLLCNSCLTKKIDENKKVLKCHTCNREKRRRGEPECDDCSFKKN